METNQEAVKSVIPDPSISIRIVSRLVPEQYSGLFPEIINKYESINQFNGSKIDSSFVHKGLMGFWI